MDNVSLGVLIAGILSIISAIVAGAISIITTVRSTGKATKEVVVADAEASKLRGVVRDKKIQEIHLLVNSRLLTVLRLLVAVTKKEAERTQDPADITAFQEALAELTKAEASAKTVAQVIDDDSSRDHDTEQADAADRKLSALLTKKPTDAP